MGNRVALARGTRGVPGKNRHGGAGSVRIIGGKWKGRKLRVGAGVRPTPDRVRETLFNWLAAELPGAKVLDLFAGTGALGFEALSRGAREATLVDRDRTVAEHLRRHRDLLDAKATVVRADALCWLSERIERSERWNVVFLDPPFALGRWPQLLALAARGLDRGGVIYVESDNHYDQLAETNGLAPVRRSSAGSVCFGLLGRREHDAHSGRRA